MQYLGQYYALKPEMPVEYFCKDSKLLSPVSATSQLSDCKLRKNKIKLQKKYNSSVNN